MGNVTKEVIVNAPVEQVYNFWRNFENFPRFMENIESIQITGQDESHWKSKGPLGKTVEWNAKTISAQENKKIGWQSTSGDIETHGAVTFEEAGANATRVVVGLEYKTPGGAIGEVVAKLLSDPEDQLEQDLGRFKQVAEGADFATLSSGTPAVGSGSYTNTVESQQRGDVNGAIHGSGSGADQHSATRSTS